MLEQIAIWVEGLDTFERCFLVYFGMLFLIWLYCIDRDTKSGIHLFNSKPQYEIATNKKQFIFEVVQWGLKNLSYKGVDHLKKTANVEISYYPHKKLRGTFSSIQKKIKVYVNNHPDIDELIDTSLHEVMHLLQYYADKKNYDKRYTKLSYEHTWAKHPMEIEAVKMAATYTLCCKKYMIEQGKLRIKQ